jgi:hypothetical protein
MWAMAMSVPEMPVLFIADVFTAFVSLCSIYSSAATAYKNKERQ